MGCEGLITDRKGPNISAELLELGKRMEGSI